MTISYPYSKGMNLKKLKVWSGKTYCLIQNVAPVMIKILRSKMDMKSLKKNVFLIRGGKMIFLNCVCDFK